MNILEVRKLSFSYNGSEVLRDISFSARESEFIGILGPNGSGKSTLLRNISGVDTPLSGEILLNGKRIHEYGKREIAKTMAMLPPETFLPYDFTVMNIVLMGRSPHLDWWQDYQETDREAAAHALELVGVSDLAGRSINSLSSGERQRVFLAQAIAQQPRILLLDEPTSHLDINHQMETFELLLKFTSEKKLTVIVVSHDLNLACQYCEKIILMKDGRVLACGSPGDTITGENISRAYSPDINVALNPETGIPEVRIIRK